jgi:hypothetical protein
MKSPVEGTMQAIIVIVQHLATVEIKSVHQILREVQVRVSDRTAFRSSREYQRIRSPE